MSFDRKFWLLCCCVAGMGYYAGSSMSPEADESITTTIPRCSDDYDFPIVAQRDGLTSFDSHCQEVILRPDLITQTDEPPMAGNGFMPDILRVGFQTIIGTESDGPILPPLPASESSPRKLPASLEGAELPATWFVGPPAPTDR